MDFTPKTEKALKEEMLIPVGEYDFECVKAEEKTSKSGNPMIAINLKVFVGDGVQYANDWLMTTNPSMEFKFRHFCEATGLLQAYEAGRITPDDIKGVAGRVKIGQKDDAQYGPQNTVKDYLVPEAGAAPSTPSAAPVAAKPVAAAPKATPPHARATPGVMEDSEIPF